MDFHSLLRRDLQFLCKRNKIPANMTNLAMADALNSLEIVEGLNEYMNQSNSNVLQSPTSVAKQPPITATRTTRRKTAVKAEPHLSSQLVNRSCLLTSKSLDGEMDQENMNKNVAQEPKTNNVKSETRVAKTPAARSTRKAPAAAACSSKVQESKKGEMVQSAYSTRRSTRLLEKSMADLSLKTKETLDSNKPEKNEETEQKVSAQQKNPAGSEERSEEAEVIPGRDLSASMEKEWEMLKNDSDQVIGGLEIPVGFGDDFLDANTEANRENMNEESENNLVQVDKQEETLQADEAICEEGSTKNDNDQEIMDLENCVDHGEIPVLEHANTETNNDNKESKDTQAFESLGQFNHLEIEQAIQENDSEPEKVNAFDEETVVDKTDGDSETEPEEDDSGVDSDSTISEADSNQADHQEIAQAIKENDSETEKIITFDDSEPEKINVFDEEIVVDRTDGDSETELEEDDSGVDSDGTISEADSNQADHQEIAQAIKENDSETEKIITFDDSEPEKINVFDEEIVVDRTDGDSETEPEEDDSGVDLDGIISEADSNLAEHQETEQAIQENDSEPAKINAFDEETVVDKTDGDSETEPEEGVDSAGIISEADSNQADHQETEQAIKENVSETEKINTFDEDTMVYQTDGGSETEPEEGVDLDGTISEADSNQAVQGSDIADEEISLSESEGFVAAPTSHPEEAIVETTPLSPFAAESISAQFPRPSKPATTPSKNSAMKLASVDNNNKENNMEMMVNVVNNSDTGESKGEAEKKKKKKVEIDEEKLKDVSMRQLVKMVKKLTIKGTNNRTALQMLPGNNQIAE